MSALTDLFTAMANKIRSKTGTATTYTPTEMVSDGIDDVYDAGVESATTPITPSNTNPVVMAPNTGYKTTASGVAISSYSNVTPTNIDPPVLTQNKIVKIQSGGYAIYDYSDLTPSNSSPVPLQIGTFRNVIGSGYAVSSYVNRTPSNSSPGSLSSGSVYKMNGNGYAIASYSSKTPSDSNPPSVASGDIVKMGGAGYLVSSLPYNFSAPTYVKQANMSSSGTMSQTTSSRAKLVIALRARYGDNAGQCMCMIWDEVNKRGYLLQYGSSYVHNAVDDTQDTIIVTDTNVTFKNKASSTQRGHLLIWC